MGLAGDADGQGDPRPGSDRYPLAKVGRMIASALFGWMRRNLGLVLLITVTVLLPLSLSQLLRGDTWSLFIPIACTAALCGWGVGRSRIQASRAALGLVGVGVPGVFILAGGLLGPLGILILSVLSLIPQAILWLSRKTPVDLTYFSAACTSLGARAAVSLTRTWAWIMQVGSGKFFMDPVALAIAWSILLWLICAWSGWRLRRNQDVLGAFLPGGLLLALVLDYSQREFSLMLFYLAVILALLGLMNNTKLNLRWQARRIDYAESIAFDSFVMIAGITLLLASAAALAPSLSWRALADRIRERDRGGNDRLAQSLGLPPPPPAPANKVEPDRAVGMPRSLLITTPPKLLQNVVMTIRTGEVPPIDGTLVALTPPHYYWRMTTYDVYTGSGWVSSSTQDTSLPANALLLKPPAGFRAIHQSVMLAPDQSPQLYWTGLFAQADVDLQISWRSLPPTDPEPASAGDMLGALTDTPAYNAVSYLPQYSAAQLRASGTDYPPEVTQRYLGLPGTVPERVFVLARDLTEAAPTPYDRALAIEAYLRRFQYSLDIPPTPPGRDIVDYFLFDLQKGYCDYYASAMVVLARAAGLPSRIVVGYASDEYDASTAEYIIRRKDAHSWAEVYFAGLGWMEFEPTAAAAPIIRPGDRPAAANSPTRSSILSQMQIGWLTLISTFSGQFVLSLAGLLALAILWPAGELWALYWLPSEAVVLRLYDRLEKLSARLVPGLPANHTPRELQAALLDGLQTNGNRLVRALSRSISGEIEQVAGLYEIQVYSRHTSSRSQVNHGIQAWAGLRWKLWIAVGSLIFRA
jgi:transglutaminase-like putative cysteine protease